MGNRLSGRVAFVTVGDGPGGDGRAEGLVRALADEGVAVVLVAGDPGVGGHMAEASAAAAVFCVSGDDEADIHALVELAGDLVGRGSRQA